MCNTKIKTIHGLIAHVKKNSLWRAATIRRTVQALGYSVTGGFENLKGLSTQLVNCAEHGASVGFPGFIYYADTIAFYKKNRLDIAANIEQSASDCGMDIIEFVQCFGVFRDGDKPTAGEIGKALWGSGYSGEELDSLYNVFSWYALEEVSHTWFRYLEDNPAYHARLSA